MKKVSAIFFLLFFPVLAFAGVAVLGGSTPPPSGDGEETCTGACVFVSSWTGTDIVNSGTSYTWTAEDDAGGRLSHGLTADTGWNDEDNYLHYSGSSTAIARVYKNITATGALGIRLGFNLVSESLANGEYQRFVTVVKLGAVELIQLFFYQSEGVLYVQGKIINTGSSIITVGTVEISTGTWYQVQLKWQKNTGNGFSFEVWNEAGTAQVGVTQTLADNTTYNGDADRVSVGVPYAASKTTEHDIDIVKITNTYDFPGVITP